MDNPICNKISILIELYVEGKLDIYDKILVEKHLADCPDCRNKYVKMKDTIKNLRSSYEHLLEEFNKIEKDKIFKIKEHEIFNANISSYIDNELSYEESVNFRKYLLKSKPARKKLEEAYSLENSLKATFKNYSDNLRLNYAANIMKEIKSERKELNGMIFKRMMFTLGILLIFSIAFFLYVTTTYNKQVSDNIQIETNEVIPDIDKESWEEDIITPSENITSKEEINETDEPADVS